ncbi:MAG: hypothetical protein EP332_05370 [Bacteroidetes bacterium]|nr:MAG: hypothetical protein EP332_05370 [Bacteroidota bacterium]
MTLTKKSILYAVCFFLIGSCSKYEFDTETSYSTLESFYQAELACSLENEIEFLSSLGDEYYAITGQISEVQGLEVLTLTEPGVATKELKITCRDPQGFLALVGRKIAIRGFPDDLLGINYTNGSGTWNAYTGYAYIFRNESGKINLAWCKVAMNGSGSSNFSSLAYTF